MKLDAILICTLATIFGNCLWPVAAYVAAPLASQSATQSQSHKNAAALAAQMLTYPAAATYLNLNAANTGSVSFQPHDSEDEEDANERASVYDPGDELLRALNSELAANGHELGTLPEEPDYADTVFSELEEASKYEMMRKLESDLREEQEVMGKTAVLMKLLEDPTIETLPVVYVEETAADESNNMLYPSGTGMTKRSRYYRRYPWKRHNRNRSTYEPELRYACTPTKEDVFKLLVNLHENRKGNHSKTVNFCNRKRPAKAIFTNIRFLG